MLFLAVPSPVLKLTLFSLCSRLVGETLYVNDERKHGTEESMKEKAGKRKLIKRGMDESK